MSNAFKKQTLDKASFIDETSFHDFIPGGAHTYSKGDDQFPLNAPKTLERGLGAFVWDGHNQKFLDWTMGLRSVTLGYGWDEVDQAAIDQLRKGSSFSRPTSIELELAEEIVNLIPSADMIKFCKNGSNSNSAALKLARAYTGRKYIAYCQDHPFFSFDDWFIGRTACNNGVPEEHYTLSLPFSYGKIDSLKKQFEDHKGQIAAIIMEAATICPNANKCQPTCDLAQCSCKSFLHEVQDLCRKEGALFILDEVITGFRWHLQGAQTYFGVTPDLTTFGKGIANGHSVSAVCGRKEIMELGGIHHNQPRLFLMSTTYGAEAHSLAAALATIRVYQKEPVVEHLWSIGKDLIIGLNKLAQEKGIQDYFTAYGFGCRPEYICKNAQNDVCLSMRTLFLQEMIKGGVIMNYIVPSYSHQQEHIKQTLEAASKAFDVYKKALEDGVDKHLVGHSIKQVFRKYN
jgi:glutamate-1-semialdehyde 2,1-aminomutase